MHPHTIQSLFLRVLFCASYTNPLTLHDAPARLLRLREQVRGGPGPPECRLPPAASGAQVPVPGPEDQLRDTRLQEELLAVREEERGADAETATSAPPEGGGVPRC